MIEQEGRFFQVGGAVREGGFYVSRPADRELPAALLRGEFCYVLAPRQIGKSSLRVRTKQLLEQQGVRCVSIDLTTIGSRDSSVEQWYFGILDEIAEQLGLPSPEEFWKERALNSAVHRFSLYLRRVLLEEVGSRIVIFIDELDAVLSQPGMQRDDFFAAVRACYNARAEDPAYERLCFCLIGVALPGDLIADETRTPFNVGCCISLSDFTREEMNEFLPGLARFGEGRCILLDEIFAWTSGHPYMAQKICQALTVHEGECVRDAVELVVHALFVRRGRVLESNLAYAEKFFAKERSSSRTLAMLRLYGRLRAGEKIVAQGQDPVQVALRLTGMAREQSDNTGSWIHVRNRIFATVFDLDWVRREESSLVFAEPLHRWIESQRSEDHVLRGQSLESARSWARGQRELSAEEGAFLLASLDVAEREAADRRRLAEALHEAERAAEEQARWRRQSEATRDQQRNILIVTEAWERFGFYLTLTLLFAYLREALQFTEERARYLYGLYVSLGYFAPLGGGILADRVLGHRWAVVAGSFLLTAGYASLASIQRSGFFASIALLSLGHGLFKPSIAALLGVLYRQEDMKRDHAFGWFYVGINAGALAAVSLGPPLSRAYGYSAAFGIGAIGMLVGFSYFIISSRNFVWTASSPLNSLHRIAAAPTWNRRQLREAFLLLAAATLFWVAFSQNGQPEAAWAREGDHALSRLLSGAMSADMLNCIFVILLGPLILYVFRWLNSVGMEFTTTSKMIAGIAVTAGAFALLALASLLGIMEMHRTGWWAIGAILVLSAAEFCVAPMAGSLIAKLTPPQALASTLGCWYAAKAAAGLLARQIPAQWWGVWPHHRYFAVVCGIALAGGLLFALQLRRMERVLRPPCEDG